MSDWLPGGKYHVYGAGLYRERAPIGCPNKVFKPGITTSLYPLTRIRYRGTDEPYPITDAFEKQCIIDFVTCSCKEEAKWLEKLIMEALREPGRLFHDRQEWEEPVNDIGAILCGITEMCPWDEDKCCLFLALLQAYRDGIIMWK